MKGIFQILLLLLPLLCCSQQRTVDSLQRLLAVATIDSARYSLLFRIGYNYSAIDYDSALFYYNSCVQVAQKNGKKLNEAFALCRKGFVLARLQRVTEAFQVLTAALQLTQDRRNENKFWNISKELVEDKDFRLRVLANIHNVFGLFMRDVDRVAEAVFHYNEARKIWEAIGDSTNVGIIISNLGVAYWKGLNEPDSALLMARKAESLFLQEGDEIILGGVYTMIGASYAAKHNDRLALTYLYKGIALNKKYDKQDMLAATYRELTKFYLKEKRADSSLYYARKAMNIHLSVFPMDLGEDYQNLSKSYELNHQPDSAYKYQGIALTTYDSLYQKRIKGLTGFQQLSFNQQQQLQQLEAERIATKTRIRIYALLSGLSVILLIGFFLYRNNQQQKKANRQIQKAYRELKATQAQLIQSEKMASLGELTAGIAHEIQNPLNFMNNFSEVNNELIAEMQEELEAGHIDDALAIASDIKENEYKITHHGKRADAIVKSMLEHSRTAKGEMQSTDINALVDEYMRLAYHGFRAKDKGFNTDFSTHLDAAVGKLNVVPQDMGRVLLNLFNNAFYAVQKKKEQLNAAYKPEVSVSTKKVDDKIEINVKDNGVGIPHKVLDKIYQPFFTTKPTGEGTGLGLSLSYDIVKAHGGEIKVETKEGEGSKFIIQLPVNTVA